MKNLLTICKIIFKIWAYRSELWTQRRTESSADPYVPTDLHLYDTGRDVASLSPWLRRAARWICHRVCGHVESDTQRECNYRLSMVMHYCKWCDEELWSCPECFGYFDGEIPQLCVNCGEDFQK